jgi:hypothetical protein
MIGRFKVPSIELKPPHIQTGKDTPPSPQQGIFGWGRLRGERNNEELSGKAFNIGERA